MMYDPKTGKGYKAKKPEDHDRMNKMGYTHDKPEVKEYSLTEALPPHLAKLFDKDGNFKDPKKQKVFDRMMGDGIGKEIAQKMGRIKFRVDANSAKKKVMVYVDQNDEKDAQRALKNHPAYVSGALRVMPEMKEDTTTASIPNPAQTSMGPTVAFLDRRSKKKVKYLKQFRDYYSEKGIK